MSKTPTDPHSALRRLCDGAAQRDPVDTPDSWLMGDGIELREAALFAACMSHWAARDPPRRSLLGDAGHLSNTVPLHSMRDRGLAARLAKLAADIRRRERGGGRRLAES